jgi:hypothetical protein
MPYSTVMARVGKNPILKNAKGRIGNVIVKQYSYGIVLSKRPNMKRVKRSPSQKNEQTRFSKAVRFAQSILRDPKLKAAYAKKLKKGQSVYHAAIKEYLKKNR